MPFVACLQKILLGEGWRQGVYWRSTQSNRLPCWGGDLVLMVCVRTWLVTNEILSSLEKSEKCALEIAALLRDGVFQVTEVEDFDLAGYHKVGTREGQKDHAIWIYNHTQKNPVQKKAFHHAEDCLHTCGFLFEITIRGRDFPKRSFWLHCGPGQNGDVETKLHMSLEGITFTWPTGENFLNLHFKDCKSWRICQIYSAKNANR